MKFFQKLWLHKWMLTRYIISGGTAAVVDLGILHICDAYFAFHYLVSVNIAFIISFGVSFLLQKYWTFKDSTSGHAVRGQVLLYFGISVFNVVLNSVFVRIFLFTHIKGVIAADFFGDFVRWSTFGFIRLRDVVSAQILAAALIACISFFIYKKFVFGKKNSVDVCIPEKDDSAILRV